MDSIIPLHVYRVTRNGAGPGGCKEYVVVAESEDRAIWYCPPGGLETADIRIKHVGAIVGAEPGVVMASYNAG